MNAVFNNPALCKRIKGVVQLGASIGEEVPEWEKHKIPYQVLIEPLPMLFPLLENVANKQPHNPQVYCYNVAVSDFDGTATFHISTGSYCSSSLLPFHREATRYGQTLQESEAIEVEVRKLDTLLSRLDMENLNLLYMDVQGAERKVMEGLNDYHLKYFDFIFVEVNKKMLYEGVTLWHEFNQYMLDRGMKLADYRELEGSLGTQGEALYFNSSMR